MVKNPDGRPRGKKELGCRRQCLSVNCLVFPWASILGCPVAAGKISCCGWGHSNCWGWDIEASRVPMET